MIQLKNVSKYYYSNGMISSGISKINLNFEIGEFVVITGESGSGKSTLLHVISGLDSYEEGEMYINGVETSHYDQSDFEEYRKKYIGNVFQEFNLVNSYTVYQNIELILLIKGCSHEEIKKRVPEIIDKVGLTSHKNTKVSKLSGGQKQRVAIARALAKDTDIIVADEPTGNLDSVSAEGIAQLLSEISKDKLVIVVTHNYEQFEKYATRTIKMHDGKVSEDKRTGKINITEGGLIVEKDAAESHSIKAGSKIRLGVRNTFNVIPKFLLLMIVFIFVVFGVTSQYTTLQHQQNEESKLGYNDYFENYSEKRIILKKVDGSHFTEEDRIAIKNVANVSNAILDDIMLDNKIFIEKGDFSYETYPMVVGNFAGKLAAGRMPESSNEAVLCATKDDYYFNDSTFDTILDETYNVALGEEKEVPVSIVGCAYKSKAEEADSMMFTGNLYITDELMATMREEIYNGNSTVKVTMNGKEQQYVPGNAFYRVVPNGNVVAGTVLVPEEINNFYGDKGAKNQQLTITTENLYYTEAVSLKVAGTYDKKSFKTKTGISDYEVHNGTVFISQSDYDTLFKKGNYQATVYVDDVKLMDNTVKALQNMGYTALPLKETLIQLLEGIESIFRVPMAVILTVAIFFIAYFVSRLILKSRSVYFAILRMLGMARKDIRRVLDVELLLIVNLAYGIFLSAVMLVKTGVVRIAYIIELIQYMKLPDFLILYMILLVMAYFISGKFARKLFKNTAMNTYREGGK